MIMALEKGEENTDWYKLAELEYALFAKKVYSAVEWNSK